MAKQKPPTRLVGQPEDPFRRIQRRANFILASLNFSVIKQFAICLLIISIHITLLSTPFLERLEFVFFDTFFKLRPAIQTNSDIVYIEIAEDSLQGIGRWPWARKYHATLIHILQTYGAKAIVFDIVFSEKSDEFNDGALLEAFQSSDNTYLPVVREQRGKKMVWIHNLPVFEKNAKGLGHINITPDSDGTLRRVKPFISLENEVYAHLALRVGFDILGKEINFGEPLPFPLDENGNLLVNWAGKWEQTYEHHSYLELIKSYEAHTRGEPYSIGPKDFKDKVCFIGLTAFGHSDIKANPIEPAYPAVGVHANVLNSILTQQFASTSQKTTNAVFMLLIGLIVSYLFTVFRRTASFLAGIATAALWLLTAYYIFVRQTTLINVAQPILMIMSLYVFSSVYTIISGTKERKHLLDLATRDGLTGLFVIRHFRSLMNQAVIESHKTSRPLALIMLDIDHFKKINDTHGHIAGDMVLRETAHLIQTEVRQKRPVAEVDSCARYGGEEFIVLLKNCNIQNAAFQVAERIRKKISVHAFEWEGKKIPVTVSLGVASLWLGENVPDVMVHRADEALYRAKEEGRNRTLLEKRIDDDMPPVTSKS